MALCFLQAALPRKHSFWYVSPLEPQTGTYFLGHCNYGDVKVKIIFKSFGFKKHTRGSVSSYY